MNPLPDRFTAVPDPTQALTTNRSLLSGEETLSSGFKIPPEYRYPVSPIIVSSHYSELPDRTMPLMPNQYFTTRPPLITLQNYNDYFRFLQYRPFMMPSTSGGINPWIYNTYPRNIQSSYTGLNSTLYSPCWQPKRTKYYSPIQIRQLNLAFQKNKYITADQRKNLASSLKLTERQVKFWFQNRRRKLKHQKPKGEISSNAQKRVLTSEEETASPKLQEKESI